MKIDFERQTERGVYRDAITLPDDHVLSEVELEAMMQQRVDNWLAFLSQMENQEPQEPAPEV